MATCRDCLRESRIVIHPKVRARGTILAQRQWTATNCRRVATLRRVLECPICQCSNPGPRTACMKALWLTAAALILTASTDTSAQVQVVNRTVNGQPNTDIRVGVYANVKPDCTSGPLPSIRLASPPENGKVAVKQGKVTATNYKQCLALEVPAFIAFYRPRADFVGVDVLTLEVKLPGGKTEVQKISVTVGTGSAGRGT